MECGFPEVLFLYHKGTGRFSETSEVGLIVRIIFVRVYFAFYSRQHIFLILQAL